jgi:hypothetical protein
VWPDSTVLNSELEPMFRRTLCAIRAKAQINEKYHLRHVAVTFC